MDDLERVRLRIYALEDGAVRAQALAFCLRIGLFDAMEQAPQDAASIASKFALAPRVLPTLLSFLASQELIVREADGRFRNTPAASAFLVRSSPAYCGGRGLLFAGFHDAVAHLPEALTSGKPWTSGGQHDMFGSFTPEQQGWFAEGMFANAVHGAAALLREVDFGTVQRLLDVGGNSGGYTITILRSHPHLRATIFDLPAVRALAMEQIRKAGLETRVDFAEGSFFMDALPTGHDALLLSSILHDWDDRDCPAILRRCFAALEAGGLAIVTEPMLAEDSTGPDHPSVSGLTMAVLGGENRTRSRVAALLREAGFGESWLGPLGEQNSVVTARKPR
jgi:hypothetical protein